MQSRWGSLTESVLNVLIGYSVAVISQLIIFPLFDIHVGLRQNLFIGLWFTVISIVRSYAVRRLFNGKANKEKGRD